ncbi:MAG: prolipoprotein diacylglyceryl transferase [Flavobacteriaceae bacterium]|nr:prolipoprotein diacylglyceryl transferase [Flavobacteriaceae bacterium]MDB4067313.1 prolipoprotein diacylglyceryl transferase [Flavobacteriaceae bacterium]MDO7575743.1 prolipoprotein diacylglyceryl transferase [Flavobacteriaceae bacterium]|tara:strand:- start:4530 stop:5381 length:852 start_codon:yes stop_codon:yes gene_type:complete
MLFSKIQWAPSDTLFKIGGFGVHYYSLMFVVAFSVGIYLMKKMYEKEKVSVDYVEPLLFYVVIATVLGARLGEVFFYSWDYYQNHLIEILLPIRALEGSSFLFGLIDGYEFTGFRGLASHGATIGILIGLYLYQKQYSYKPLIWILDRLVIPVSLGAALVRVGNFFNSEIVGNYTDNNFGVVFLNRGEIAPRHPAQLYEAIGYLALFFLLRYLYNNKVKRPNGYLFGLFFVVLFSVRFLVEFVKVSQGGFETYIPLLSTGQWLSIPMILFGLFFMFKKSKSNQ